jgi:hypothetical protein
LGGIFEEHGKSLDLPVTCPPAAVSGGWVGKHTPETSGGDYFRNSRSNFRLALELNP